MNAEQTRLQQAADKTADWKKWGPYLSERQWGTVREDYSGDGSAWDYFTHDHARSRAYRWGEDGLAGISDDRQQLCFAIALWNGRDPILKERLFGLTNSEGNHGEDVKEYYFYLDSTPTHSYMKYLYKYPQAAYPYDEIVRTNRNRSRHELEYELLDTRVFEDNRYFDVFVEYAKASPQDMLVEITVHNRGPEAATLHLLPTLWFRNTWAGDATAQRPALRQVAIDTVVASHPELGSRTFFADGTPELLFTENESNTERLAGVPNVQPFVKDAINNYIVHGHLNAVNPQKQGTKVAAHYVLNVPARGSETVRVRLTDAAPPPPVPADRAGAPPFGRGFDSIFKSRRDEADEFYAAVIPTSIGDDEKNVMRQALAGMMWTKQFYLYDVDRWLSERGADPFKPTARAARNDHWHHMYNGDVISMPDKWEYPWYAAWDLAFHVLALTMVDPDFGKQQLQLMLRERYMHPNGQIPAYEWNFGDVNPPVHAWATYFTYTLDKIRRGGQGDVKWLKSCFQKLLLNFTWWVNRKDRHGRNVFEGGFLGLDNIGVFDRSAPLPTGGYLEQADGTAWMSLFASNMLEIAMELAKTEDEYVDMVLKFIEHDAWVTSSLIKLGEGVGMWDEEDGFFYDVLRLDSGEAQRLKIRSMVGLLPLCAATAFPPEVFDKYPVIARRFARFLDARPELCACCHDPTKIGKGGRRLFSVLDETRLRRVLATVLDPNEFLSDYGIRSLSRFHERHPYTLHVGGTEHRVPYLPAESDTGTFGGNSNWRGPIWMPVNILIVRALIHYYVYYGDDFLIECPTGSGRMMNFYQVAEEISRRLASIFLRDPDSGHRPVYGATEKFQSDPHWRDLILFYEYFHGDNGAGIGASHQTGWTGIIARTMHMFATSTAEEFMKMGKAAVFVEVTTTPAAAQQQDDRRVVPST